jgi:calreticulin
LRQSAIRSGRKREEPKEKAMEGRRRGGPLVVAGLIVLSLIGGGNGEVFFQEEFNDGWEQRWKGSTWKQDEGMQGQFIRTAGQWYGDPQRDLGLQTSEDARFFALWSELRKPFSNAKRDLVLQYQVKHEQSLDCGGGYIKLLPASSAEQMDHFGGDTPYSIMFGPDICGMSTKKVHMIFEYNGENRHTKKNVPCETDQLSHVYTFVIHPNNTYSVLIDLEERASGELEKDWDLLPPSTIDDPNAEKPKDWDDREYIDDPEDVKPEGYDDIPAKIADPNATKPEDWDEEEDGEWEPPLVDNPEYKGPWKPRRIKNPNYQGTWHPPQIDNPDYTPDFEIYRFDDLKYVGFELWQVKSGSIFDNILVTDDLNYAMKFANETWGASKDAEKEMKERVEAERKAQEEPAGESGDEESEELDEEDYELDDSLDEDIDSAKGDEAFGGSEVHDEL